MKYFRINYHGQGFEYGDCGIKISNIQKDEEGVWQCVTRLYGREYEEAVGRIEVEIISGGARSKSHFLHKIIGVKFNPMRSF